MECAGESHLLIASWKYLVIPWYEIPKSPDLYITVIIAIKRWINNWLLPELTVHRGQTYYFKVLNWNIIVTWNFIRIGHYDLSLRSKAATTKSLEVWTIILFTSLAVEMGDMVFFKDLSIWALFLMIIMIRIDYASWDELIKCYWHVIIMHIWYSLLLLPTGKKSESERQNEVIWAGVEEPFK